MNCERVVQNGVPYLQVTADEICIFDESGLFDLLSCSYEQDADRFLLHDRHFCSSFFDISSGLAGAFMQKLTNYRHKTAIVVDETTKTSALFSQMTRDANRLGCVHFFKNDEDAVQWLTAE